MVLRSDKNIAIKAIRQVHGNTSASLEEVLEALQEIADYLDEYLDAINEDISRRDQRVGNE